jgi:predicted HTH domain antitoxin
MDSCLLTRSTCSFVESGVKYTNSEFYIFQWEIVMQSIQHVCKTDLARNTRQVINNVLRGQTAVVESHGQPEVAIMDIVDYRITRAVMRYYSQQPVIDVEQGLADQRVALTSDAQDRYNLVLAHYLAGAISLGRAAELLDLPWLDLRGRFLRLDVPLRTVLTDLHEARLDFEVAEAWAQP